MHKLTTNVKKCDCEFSVFLFFFAKNLRMTTNIVPVKSLMLYFMLFQFISLQQNYKKQNLVKPTLRCKLTCDKILYKADTQSITIQNGVVQYTGL